MQTSISGDPPALNTNIANCVICFFREPLQALFFYQEIDKHLLSIMKELKSHA